MDDTQAKLDQILSNQRHIAAGVVTQLVCSANLVKGAEAKIVLLDQAVDIIRMIFGETEYQVFKRELTRVEAKAVNK